MNRKQFIKTVIGATIGLSSAFAMTTQAADTIKLVSSIPYREQWRFQRQR